MREVHAQWMPYSKGQVIKHTIQLASVDAPWHPALGWSKSHRRTYRRHQGWTAPICETFGANLTSPCTGEVQRLTLESFQVSYIFWALWFIRCGCTTAYRLTVPCWIWRARWITSPEMGGTRAPEIDVAYAVKQMSTLTITSLNQGSRARWDFGS